MTRTFPTQTADHIATARGSELAKLASGRRNIFPRQIHDYENRACLSRDVDAMALVCLELGLKNDLNRPAEPTEAWRRAYGSPHLAACRSACHHFPDNVAHCDFRVLELGDRVFIIEDGRVGFGGTPAEIAADDGLPRAYFRLGV